MFFNKLKELKLLYKQDEKVKTDEYVRKSIQQLQSCAAFTFTDADILNNVKEINRRWSEAVLDSHVSQGFAKAWKKVCETHFSPKKEKRKRE